jgi:hypothetical protein
MRGVATMKRSIILAAIFVSALVWSAANAGVVWEGEFQTFRYGVEWNGGNFQYNPAMYFSSSSAPSVLLYNPIGGSYDPYNGTALGDLVEFPDLIPGEIRLRGMAKGPDGGISPPRGIVVQGFTEILHSDLGADHGVDIEQKVVCWVTRRFSVNSSGSYIIAANLDGVVNFNDFGSAFPFLGTHSVGGTVEVIGTFDEWLTTFSVASFPLSEVDRDGDSEVSLETNAEYQFVVVLNIETKLMNFNLQSGIAGVLPAGDYKVGETGAPMVLNAIIYDPNELELGLADAIKILQVLAGLEPAIGDLPGDLSGDGKLGLQEVIYGLQNAAELR